MHLVDENQVLGSLKTNVMQANCVHLVAIEWRWQICRIEKCRPRDH